MVQKSRSHLFVALFVWLLLAVGGLALLSNYEGTAGPSVQALPQWPSTSKLTLPPHYTLVLAIHPQCPCTRATLDELALLLARCPQLSAQLLFLHPQNFDDTWVKSDLWQRAQAMPRVHCISDLNGTEAALFHATTSGTALLYSSDGRLLFEGGITPARGHAGDNAGVDTIVSITHRPQPSDHTSVTRTNVYGCPLYDDASTSGNTE